MAASSKKKCRQYSLQYLFYGFVPSPNDQTKPTCLIRLDLLSNNGMKRFKLKIYLETKHKEKN